MNTEGVMKHLGAQASGPTPILGGFGDGIEQALVNLARVIQMKNLDIEVQAPHVRVEPPAMPAPQVTIQPPPNVNEIKVEPAAVFIKGMEPKHVYYAAAIVAIPTIADLVTRLIQG